jgi:hypothetical protein
VEGSVTKRELKSGKAGNHSPLRTREAPPTAPRRCYPRRKKDRKKGAVVKSERRRKMGRGVRKETSMRVNWVMTT